MEEKMKKMLFLMLFLIILGAASVNAQVRIGGNGQPNPAAVFLNADNNVTGTKGLALPRVSLTDINTALTGNPTVNGMMVYNTNASVTGGSGVGIYYWVTNKWVKMLNSDFVEGDGVVGNEVKDAITGGGLRRYGNGTYSSPYTLGLDTAGFGNKSGLSWDGHAWVPAFVPALTGDTVYAPTSAWNTERVAFATPRSCQGSIHYTLWTASQNGGENNYRAKGPAGTHTFDSLIMLGGNKWGDVYLRCYGVTSTTPRK